MLNRQLRFSTDAIEKIESSATLEEIARLSCSLAANLGFRYFGYRSDIRQGANADASLSYTNLPSSWQERYRKFGARDFALGVVREHSTPRCWTARRFFSDVAEEVFASAGSLGIIGGISCPVCSHNGDASVVTWIVCEDNCGGELSEFIEPRAAFCALAALHIHEAIRRAHRRDTNLELSVRLTPRERDCLGWISLGKTNWEIAQIMGISEHGVVHHVRKLMEKLGVNRRHEAVRVARALNLI